MQLDEEARGLLADSLWESLLTDDERAIQQAWADEAERRLEEMRSRKVKGIPWETVRAELIAKYGAQRRTS